MARYVLRRLLHMVPVLLGVALVVFALFHAAAEDPARVALGQHADPEAAARLRAQWQLDRPLVWQFFAFLEQIARFDYGRSFTTHETLGQLIAAGAPVSLALTVPPFVIGLLVNLALALLITAHAGRALDRIANVLFTATMSTSYLVYIVILQYVLAHRWGWFPVGGYGSGAAAIQHLALPWLILLLVSVGPDVRIYRSILQAESTAQYTRTARAKGAGSARVLLRHVLPNALVPILAYVLSALPVLWLGAFLTERYFSLPGLGDLLVFAIDNGDFPLIKGLTMTLALAHCASQLGTDLLCAWIDPRIRLQ